MTSANINPIYFLSPLIPLVFSFGVIFYWRAKKGLKWMVLAYALVAYALAIIIKTVFQTATVSYILSNFGAVSIVTGLYYGLQTCILEVGLAFAVAAYAVRRKNLSASDTKSYGLSLGFWENGILLGIFPLVSLLSDYLVIAYYPSLAGVVRSALISAQPSLFEPTSASSLLTIGLSALERLSSLLAHLSWGILVVLAATRRKLIYFAIAFPMGLIDALVPYAGSIGLVKFELILFALTVLFIFIAILAERRERTKKDSGNPAPPA